MQPIRSITIVGGGTAGWLAACYLQRRLSTAGGPRITLVESPGIGTIGVGESTVPTLRATMAAIGIGEQQLLRAADATLKNGVRLNGWRVGGPATEDSYDHPFDVPPPLGGFSSFAHWLNLQQQHLPTDAMARACTVQTALFDAHAAPKALGAPDYAGAWPYAYHLDATKLAVLLSETATARGVRHQAGEVVHVLRGSDGGIAALQLADGSTHAADFFIDCSGFRALLLGQALAVPWVNFGDALLCARAAPCPVAHGSERTPLRSFTTATAHGAGWTWEVDLQSRSGTGYVYSSAHCSDDEAVGTLLRHHDGARALAEPRLLRMRAGHHARAWDHNCVAIGLAGGFIEPLESTAIFLIEHALEAVAAQLLAPGPTATRRDGFNAAMRDVYEELRDFIVLHYVLSARRDTAFWRDATAPERLPDSLAHRLARWTSRLPEEADLGARRTLFGPNSWFCILAGLGRLPATLPGDAPTLQASQDALRQLQARRASAVRQMPSMRAFVRRLHALPG